MDTQDDLPQSRNFTTPFSRSHRSLGFYIWGEIFRILWTCKPAYTMSSKGRNKVSLHRVLSYLITNFLLKIGFDILSCKFIAGIRI